MTTTPTDESLVSEVHTGPALLGMAAAAGVDAGAGSALGVLADGFEPDEPTDPPSAPWRQMLDVLARSARRVDGAVSGSDGSLVMAFHGDGDHWVGLWPEGDGFRVTGPLTDRGLGGYLGVFFGTLRTPAGTAPVVVSDQGMTAVAATVDAWRSARLAEWLRHSAPGSTFSADGMTQALYAGKRSADGRWLVALLGDVTSAVREVADVSSGLDELTEDGLVRTLPGADLELGAQLTRLADDTWFPLPALTMTIGAGSPERRLVAARGRDTVWTMSTSGGGWHIEGRDGLGLAELIAELIAG